MAKARRNRLLKTRCWYCGRQLTRRIRTRDHVLPRCMGGQLTLGNVVPACRACNELKAALLLDTFRFLYWTLTGRPIFFGEGEHTKEL